MKLRVGICRSAGSTADSRSSQLSEWPTGVLWLRPTDLAVWAKEDKALLSFVKKHGTKKWVEINLEHRTGKQCRER